MAKCHAHGIRLTALADGRLEVDGPAGSLTPDLVASLRKHKTGLLVMLHDEAYELEERAAILEFDAGLPRHEAERLALRMRQDGSPVTVAPPAIFARSPVIRAEEQHRRQNGKTGQCAALA